MSESNIGSAILGLYAGIKSGTTAEVAQRLGRKWVGIELNPEYTSLIKKRTAQKALF